MKRSLSIPNAFSKNRTEELDADVWQQFVVPPYFEKTNLLGASKPQVVIGGRGCGKTMLLKYYSHQSQFSIRRQDITEESFGAIGLYWKVDTQFSNAMKGRGRGDADWGHAFDHFLALCLTLELVQCLKSIQSCRLGQNHSIGPGHLQLNRLCAYDSQLATAASLEDHLETKLAEFELWVSNTSKIPEPVFYPGVHFVTSAIKDIRSSFPLLSTSIFHVYIDEFENLTEHQQRIINTRIKHSSDPLLFNIAMKRRGFVTKQTLGSESIVEIADYRSHDLEAYIDEDDFLVFAAEVVALKFQDAGVVDAPVSADILRDPIRLGERADKTYRSSLRQFLDELLPTPSHHSIAVEILSDVHLRRKLLGAIEKALKSRGSSFAASSFLDDELPEESIVTFALIARDRSEPEQILLELQRKKAGEESKFSEWVHNNLIGCVLYLYSDSYRECPFYAGFRSFCRLAKGNLRHLLELVYRSYLLENSSHIGEELTVSPKDQAKAARQTSVAFLREVRGFGVDGEILHGFILRLGSLFSLAHKRPTQSEPEVTHFTIKNGGGTLSLFDQQLLNEAIKWSVIFEVDETKLKEPAERQISAFEYILNPIYSPFFNISYRKKRKLEIRPEEIHILFSGSSTEVRSLYDRFITRWGVNPEDGEPTLFSYIPKSDT